MSCLLEAKEMKVPRKIIGKIKIDRIRSQQSENSIVSNQLMRRKREWYEHVTRIDAEILVKISRYSVPAGRRSPGRPKRRWNDLVCYLVKTGGTLYNKKKKVFQNIDEKISAKN